MYEIACLLGFVRLNLITVVVKWLSCSESNYPIKRGYICRKKASVPDAVPDAGKEHLISLVCTS